MELFLQLPTISALDTIRLQSLPLSKLFQPPTVQFPLSPATRV